MITRKERLQKEKRNRRWYPHPVVARKHYNGVTIGYIVGWKHRFCSMVKNIRAGLVFKNEEDARTFRDNMEGKRVSLFVEFDILDE